VIIPIIEGSGILSFAGILLIFLGFILLMVAFVSGSYEWGSIDDLGWDNINDESYSKQRAKKTTKARKLPQHPPGQQPQPSRPRRAIKTGGVIFIGPIPIIWGSDKRIGYIMAIVAVVLVVIFLIFTLAWVFNGFSI
jgi:uncharacterized protein (TIGR00304 family)